VTVSCADEVKRNWDEIKREEKRLLAERAGVPVAGQAEPSALDGAPFAQPALALAAQLQRRAARAGVPDDLARLDGGKGTTSAGSCSGWSPGPGRRAWTLIWSSGPPRAVIATRSAHGSTGGGRAASSWLTVRNA